MCVCVCVCVCVSSCGICIHLDKLSLRQKALYSSQ